MTEPVAARYQERFTLSCEGLLGAARAGHHASINNPMHEHPPLARVQHDFPAGNFGYTGSLDGNQVTGKDGRHHAGAEDTETYFSECADNISRQATCLRRRHIFPPIHKRFDRGL